MVKTPSLGVRLHPEVKAALQRAAEADLRSISSMVEKILIEWLRDSGHLPRPGAAAAEPGPVAPKTKAAGERRVRI
jgi:hypothetical protein